MILFLQLIIIVHCYLYRYIYIYIKKLIWVWRLLMKTKTFLEESDLKQRWPFPHLHLTPLSFVVHFPAVFSLWWEDQLSAGSRLFLSLVAVIKISSKANCLCRRITAFAPLIGNANPVASTVLAMTSSVAGGHVHTCVCVRALAVLRRCNQFRAR